MELYAPVLWSTLLLWLTRVKAEIRCHCNDASCVATGYMCKSEIGRCFTLLSYDGERSRSAHGCVDFLPHPDRTYCEGHGDVLQTRGGVQGWPILMCCQEDMCNYMNSVDINIYVNTKPNRTSILNDKKENHNNNWRHTHGTPIDGNSSSGELWFKAAVIAVPIAGGFILILLVLLAIRMLRSDTKRHSRLMQMRKHRSLTKAQLYVADHFSDNSEPLTHTNCIEKHNNVYKDVNITLDYDETLYDSQKDTKKVVPHSGSCSSIILWGGKSTCKEKTATVV